ncbi:hypothetical protein ABFX02_06G165800 [Erythranthe guttata]
MATHFPDQLYHSYPDIFRGYILTVLDSLRGREGKAHLADFLKEWRRHNWMMVTLSPSLEDLVVPHDSLPLNQVGNECFSNVVYKELKVEILDATSSLIDGLRQQNGKMGDHFLMKRLLTSIHEIGVRDDFELELKNVVRAVCSQRASGWIENGTLVEYMVEAKEYMRKENDLICSHLAYLRENSKRNFLKVVQNQLLSTYINRLLEIGHSGPSLKENKLEHFSWIFSSEKMPQGLKSVADNFEQHIMAEVALVKEVEDDAHKMIFMRKIMSLHRKFKTFVNDCLLEHDLFHEAIRRVFSGICNVDIAGSSPAELLALFCNDVLKRKKENVLGEDIETTLEHVIEVLVLIEDKRLFAESYVRSLALRLLYDASIGVEIERSMMKRLKGLLDYRLIMKMETMFKDLQISSETDAEYKEHVTNNPEEDPGIDFSMTLLSMGRWPSFKLFDLNLPEEMERCIEKYSTFFRREEKPKRLRCVYSMGTCDIDAHFEETTLKLKMTTAQAAVLVQFNASERLSCQQIMDQLKLSHQVVAKLLRSLSSKNCQILLKESGTEEVSLTDVFLYNSKFTSKLELVRVPLPREKYIISVDILSTTRCAIIRVMKSRKVFGYEQLVTECINQLQHLFEPKIANIKICIEALISEGFLERGKFDRKLLKYSP